MSSRKRKLVEGAAERRETIENSRRRRNNDPTVSSGAADALASPDVLDMCLAHLPYTSLQSAAAVSSFWKDRVNFTLRTWRVLDLNSIRTGSGQLSTPTHVVSAPAWLEFGPNCPTIISYPAAGRLQPPLGVSIFGDMGHMKPTGVAFAGRCVYVASRHGEVRMYRLEITPTSPVPRAQLLAKTVAGALTNPEGVCCVGNSVFVCDRGRHQVVKLDAADLSVELRFGQAVLFEPAAIVERHGELFVTGSRQPANWLVTAPFVKGVGGEAAVAVFWPDGSLVRTIAHPLLREGRGLAFVRDHLVVAEYDSRGEFSGAGASTKPPTRLLCFAASGELRQVIPENPAQRQRTKGWASLFGCAVAGNGELHVVDAGALVTRTFFAQ